MNPKNQNDMQADPLAGDLLDGATEIAAFLTSLGVEMSPQDIYYHVAAGNLRVARMGSKIIGSKAALRRTLAPTEAA